MIYWDNHLVTYQTEERKLNAEGGGVKYEIESVVAGGTVYMIVVFIPTQNIYDM